MEELEAEREELASKLAIAENRVKYMRFLSIVATGGTLTAKEIMGHHLKIANTVITDQSVEAMRLRAELVAEYPDGGFFHKL